MVDFKAVQKLGWYRRTSYVLRDCRLQCSEVRDMGEDYMQDRESFDRITAV